MQMSTKREIEFFWEWTQTLATTIKQRQPTSVDRLFKSHYCVKTNSVCPMMWIGRKKHFTAWPGCRSLTTVVSLYAAPLCSVRALYHVPENLQQQEVRLDYMRENQSILVNTLTVASKLDGNIKKTTLICSDLNQTQCRLSVQDL